MPYLRIKVVTRKIKLEEFEKHFNVEKAKAIEEKQRKWNCFKN